jgi:hypothetical protein
LPSIPDIVQPTLAQTYVLQFKQDLSGATFGFYKLKGFTGDDIHHTQECPCPEEVHF